MEEKQWWGWGVQPAAWPLMASRDSSCLEAQRAAPGAEWLGRAERRFHCCPLPQTDGSSRASEVLGPKLAVCC